MTSCYDQLLSAFQYHVTISWAQIYSSLRSLVLLQLNTDQVLVFDWIVGSCQGNLLKTEPGCSMFVWKPVNSNLGVTVKQIITVSFIHMFFVYSFCFLYRFCDYSTQNRRSNNMQKTSPQSSKTQIKIQPYPGLA